MGGGGILPAAGSKAELDDDAYWSGRTVTVPGWVSAAHGAWKKWGKK